MKQPPNLRDKNGQAVVTLTDSKTHQRRDFYCGEWGTVESRTRYADVIGQWELAARRWPCIVPVGQLTIVELIRQYRRWSDSYYTSGEANTIRYAVAVIVESYADLAAVDFGPLKLRDVQRRMVAKGWSRSNINRQIHRVCAVFKWASSNELLPITVYQALKSVSPLKRGRCDAPESKPVRPVDDSHVNATLPWLSRQVATMVQLQRLTGARPGELFSLKPGDIKRSDDVWTAEITEHKTSHLGKDRSLHFGPAAQQVLAPWLMRPETEYLFSPAEAEDERIKSKPRKTPAGQGNVATGKRRKDLGEIYNRGSYRRAINRAADRANSWAKGGVVIDSAARLIPRWHPYQLRHNAATAIRKAFGLEAAQIALGHSSAAITDAVYAERDTGKIREIMRQIG
jgi:integrase